MEMETNFWRSGSLERYNFGEIWLFISLTSPRRDDWGT
jgi:hypothetical protein